MYRNYKIRNDGELKYSDISYTVAPERRFNKTTDEWQKRLDGKGPKLYKRRVQKKEKGFRLRVIDTVYIIAFFAIIAIVNKSNIMFSLNNNTVNNNAFISGQNTNIDFNFNGATSDFGNEYIKSTAGNYFLHINMDISNGTNNDVAINGDDFKLVDENGTIYQARYIDNQSMSMAKSIVSNHTVGGVFTFQLPTSYKGQFRLYFDNDVIGRKDIISLNMN